jgi:dipeptidyl aminopeptidase/acylaminoacyl peptidase
VVDADGSDRKRLASGLFPSWSPDGKRIVYTAYAGERPYLAVMNSDGSESRSLSASLLERLSGRVSDEEPAWSPDGEKIAFAHEANGDLYVMNSDGSGADSLDRSTELRSLATDLVPRQHPHRFHLRGCKGLRDLRDELRRIGPHEADRRTDVRRLPRMAAVNRTLFTEARRARL